MSMHEQGILHGDLKAANVMLHGEQNLGLQLLHCMLFSMLH
jgi:tRNA A-37 threonylcarbamoyl transferase component Bud32